ncbi:MAG: methylenetetrahydrofolate reductase C-terminal domain-containing protein [Candidatus Omnitrophica bacterium]|nr:methylenetetrahydrofolate reductase C-terminal domain-containing protein [Candidatus Omnitrophota bacterium]MBU1047318.1 methylenetetrahydrofolate reductase C-terminal domain-containing protein [Candidatus Omnitrophota bacterium]MBU1630645.1 methylenetetrahydrofolate reductase C-terminal domain-containing protein [Candidatus Omnitrophota bacterium]MBU1766483.1 methylenetetrahydrofolate reductase C-terminal domain-containing protein [Candidatus Omnitrophota bacterium]MBU1889097.1 methylenetet
MLITKLKNKEEILLLLEKKPFIIKCFGCKEVYFPEDEIEELLKGNESKIIGVARLDYLCREEFSKLYLTRYSSQIKKSGAIIVFSCGVGVQVLAKLCIDKKVLAGCDTYSLDGFQGLSVQNANCEQCGECYLNYTGGICPLTACSKGLLNGPCGGAKNGKCEVSPEMDCGWELIYKRLKGLKIENVTKESKVLIRNYKRILDELGYNKNNIKGE